MFNTTTKSEEVWVMAHIPPWLFSCTLSSSHRDFGPLRARCRQEADQLSVRQPVEPNVWLFLTGRSDHEFIQCVRCNVPTRRGISEPKDSLNVECRQASAPQVSRDGCSLLRRGSDVKGGKVCVNTSAHGYLRFRIWGHTLQSTYASLCRLSSSAPPPLPAPAPALLSLLFLPFSFYYLSLYVFIGLIFFTASFYFICIFLPFSIKSPHRLSLPSGTPPPPRRSRTSSPRRDAPAGEFQRGGDVWWRGSFSIL